MSQSKGEQLLSDINKKLEVLVTLFAANLSANKSIDNPQKIRLLTIAGFTSEEIGEIIGIRAESVRRIRSKTEKRE